MALVPFPSPKTGALPAPPDDEEDLGGRMSFLEHLDELRKRLVRSAIALAVGVAISFTFIGRIYDFVMGPMYRAIPGISLIYTEPTEAFALWIRLSLISGAVIAAPAIMWQVWKFIAPGLYSNEKRFAIPFVVLSTTGFVGGAAFNHYVMFPFMMKFFASFDTSDLHFMPRLEPVFSMYTKFLLAMGLVFQMPTIVFFLAKMRVVTARFLLKHIKFAILVIFVVAAVITPTGDPGTQTVFAAPMLGLYLVSIGIAWIVGPKGKKDGADTPGDWS
jgi:sec-independent protein translocase protein TatC